MSSSGPNSPGTIAADTSVGTRVWSTITNAGASDNSYATASYSIAGTASTQYIKATNFGFSVAGTIDGILVEIERKASSNSASLYAKDNIVKLVVGGTISGSDLADTATKYPTADAYASYGGASSLWGLTPADTDINASNFGVVISSNITSPGKSSCTVSVDHIRITVYYTGAAPSGQPTSKRFGGVPFMGAHGAGIPSAMRQWMRRDSGLIAPQVATGIWRPAHG